MARSAGLRLGSLLLAIGFLSGFFSHSLSSLSRKPDLHTMLMQRSPSARKPASQATGQIRPLLPFTVSSASTLATLKSSFKPACLLKTRRSSDCSARGRSISDGSDFSAGGGSAASCSFLSASFSEATFSCSACLAFSAASRAFPYEDAGARQIRQLRSLGITNIVQIATIDGTESEGHALSAWCKEQRFDAIVFVVTSDHSRRAQRVLSRIMKNTSIRIVVQPARYSSFDPERWWETRGGIRTAIIEMQKLILDLVLH